MQFSPEICQRTYPLLRLFAEKCDADFEIITERKFSSMPVTYEKFQIWWRAQERADDWSIFFDSDSLVHPDTPDPTELIGKDTVMHNGMDFANNRFKYDNCFRRDGRNIGSGTWFCVCSDWTLDLWHPLEDVTLEHCLQSIQPTLFERSRGVTREHLIDDYLVSRNIARYGLKFTSFIDLQKKLGRERDFYFWHQYAMPLDEKIRQMDEVLKGWNLECKSVG